MLKCLEAHWVYIMSHMLGVGHMAYGISNMSSMGTWGGPGQKPSNEQPKFFNLLVLVHLKITL